MPDTRRDDELYVGYLPVPRQQGIFLRQAVPAALVLLCVVCLLWAHSQHSPGRGVWDQDRSVRLHGLIAAKPYPVLFTQEGGSELQAVLIVEAGKRGGGERVSPFDGGQVAVSGLLLQRDGRRMLELEPGDTAIVADADAASPVQLPALKPVGPVTLRGEIVDSKCFLGAMKPGEGKAHKECATLCIRGGIPPMFVTRDANGAAKYYLLQDPTGGPIDPAVFPLIADQVEIQADLATWGGVDVLTVRREGFRRI